MSDGSRSRLSPPGRVGLVGAGAFGRFCIDAYTKSGDIDVLVVAEPDPAARSLIELRGARTVLPGTRIVADWQELIEDDRVEVVHIATPPFLREVVIDAAFQAGKSVFCEKPLALTLPEADRMIRDARRHRVVLGVDYVMRHFPAYKLLQRLALSGRLGELRTISFQNFAQSMPPDHWFWDRARSGGILVEHGVHFFDIYSQIAGAVDEAWGIVPRPESVDVGLRYAAGAIGRFYHEFAFPRPVERATGTTFFARGYVEIVGWIPTELSGAIQLPPGEIREILGNQTPELSEREGATDLRITFPDRERSYQTAIVAGMRDVVRAHRLAGYTMEVTAEDARRSLAVALAARQAADQHEVLSLDPS